MPEKKRMVYPDVLRLIATCFVIGIHTVSYAATLVKPYGTAYRILTIFVFLFLSCNLFFVMLSGALLLSVSGESARMFYLRRFTRVVLPLVFWYIFYVCAKEGIDRIYPKNLPRLLVRILSGAPEEAPHFWLVYVLLFLYLITPFLRLVTAHVSDSVFRGVLIVFFLISAISVYAPLWGRTVPVFHTIAESYAGVFLLGRYLADKCSRKKEQVFFWIMGAISFFLTCGLILFTENFESYIYGNAPTMILFCAAVFLAIKVVPYPEKEPYFLRLIGTYSYRILLIHWGVLHFVVKRLLHVDVLAGGIVGGCLLMMLLTFFISLAGAMIVEKLKDIIRSVFHRFLIYYKKERTGERQ